MHTASTHSANSKVYAKAEQVKGYNC